MERQLSRGKQDGRVEVRVAGKRTIFVLTIDGLSAEQRAEARASVETMARVLWLRFPWGKP